MLVPVILSGGAGTRLWPLSRAQHPKQFLELVEHATTFERALRRVDGLTELGAPIVVCNAAHRTFVEVQLRKLGAVALGVLLEPVGRNTAPAVAVAAEHARLTLGGDPLLLVLPSDHLVRDHAAFAAAVERGRQEADTGALVTFGIVADHPATGYGWIQGSAPGEAAPVRRFVEKPDLETAKRYLAAGDWYWNSGMFLLRASAYLQELARHRPEMAEACHQAVHGATHAGGAIMLERTAFEACPSDSIDYAVMEKTERAFVVPLDAGWSDVGSWDALWAAGDRDAHGNVTAGDVLVEDAEGCYVDSRHGLVAALGIRDLVVVATEDAVLVVPRARAQEVKALFEHVRDEGRELAVRHPERPQSWGWEHALDHVAPGVARLVVRTGAGTNRGAAPHRRAVAVSQGRARIRYGDVSVVLEPGSSRSIPAGAAWSVENVGGGELVLVEVTAID